MNVFKTVSKLAALTIILLFLSILGYAIFGDRVIIKTSPLTGKEAPDFTLTLYSSGGSLAESGKNVSLSELKGKTVILNFWASWCKPCRQEAPALERSWKKYKDKDVVFIGVNVWDDDSSALSYLDKYGGSYEHGFDPEKEIQVNYGLGGIPETYFIDSSGLITGKFTGQLTEEIIDYYLLKAISSKNSS